MEKKKKKKPKNGKEKRKKNKKWNRKRKKMEKKKKKNVKEKEKKWKRKRKKRTKNGKEKEKKTCSFGAARFDTDHHRPSICTPTTPTFSHELPVPCLAHCAETAPLLADCAPRARARLISRVLLLLAQRPSPLGLGLAARPLDPMGHTSFPPPPPARRGLGSILPDRCVQANPRCAVLHCLRDEVGSPCCLLLFRPTLQLCCCRFPSASTRPLVSSSSLALPRPLLRCSPALAR